MMSQKKYNQKIKCSVGILTFNSEETLVTCLESVSNFSEIIICDGGSTDKTIEIAEKFGCVILKQDAKFKYENNKISDFSGVRNQLLHAASHKWFTFIDSDEYFSEELVTEMGEIINSKTRYKVYRMPRRYVLRGVHIQCATAYPNYQVRFFHKDFVVSFTKKVHERIQIQENTNVSLLKNFVMVPIVSDTRIIKKKHVYYLSIEYNRLINQSYFALWTALKFNTRSVLVRIVKYIFFLVTCRGVRLSFRREFLNLKYSVRLILIIIKIILRNFFNDIKK